ncbi:MAG: hypothetical protein FJ225_11090 [Lentisphaerae bacterium]|nr:hypothetical protein [Lentisphaerota bacterium]
MQHFDVKSFPEALAAMRKPYHDNYYAMYSSVFGGVVTDPVLMLVPADDHVVHRGDGIFETCKCVDGSIYNMAAHLRRLEESAARLAFALPWAAEEMSRLAVETVRAGGRRDCCVRIIVARGPGSFGVNPRECARPALYIIVYRLGPPFMTAHPGGARAVTSTVPPKPGFFASVKSCNYLPNAIMAMEAADAGADFALGYDERGCLAEGATENVGIVTPGRELVFPEPNRLLRGTTVMRVAELAAPLVRSGALAGVAFRDIPRAEAERAAELLIVGTTRDVVAVVEWDGRPVGNGKPGPVQQALNRLLTEEIRGNRALLTPVFG